MSLIALQSSEGSTMGALHEVGYPGPEHHSVEKKALSKTYFKDIVHNILIYLLLTFYSSYFAHYAHSFGESDRQEWVSKLYFTISENIEQN